VIVTMLTPANVHTCSTLAKRHHRRQRSMFSGVGSKR
jgi:hypothetical protein